MKTKWKILATIVLLLGAALLYLFSPRRDVEVVFALRTLPWSCGHIKVSVDAWTDYVVRGYLEISPEDFDQLMAGRTYEKEDHAPRTLDSAQIPEGRTLSSTTSYSWNTGTASCRFETDESRSWVVFEYGAD